MTDEGLQSPSARSDVTRGTVITIPAGTPGAPVLIGQTLRLDAGTWYLHVCRLVQGPMGMTPADGPNLLDPTWPVALVLQHGRGVATWWEIFQCAARGTFLVRSNDGMQAAIGVLGAGFVEEQQVLLTARQIIAPVQPALVTEALVLPGAGTAGFVTPPGAQSLQLIGADIAGVATVFRDSANVVIAATPSVAPGATLALPQTCRLVEVTGLPAGAAVTATWEVWG